MTQEPSKELMEKVEIYAAVDTALKLQAAAYRAMGYEDASKLPDKRLEAAGSILAGLCDRLGTNEVKAVLADPGTRLIAAEIDRETGALNGLIDLDSL